MRWRYWDDGFVVVLALALDAIAGWRKVSSVQILIIFKEHVFVV